MVDIMYFRLKGCEPCKDQEKELKHIKGHKVKRIDIEKNARLVNKFKVKFTPTLIVKGKSKTARISGFVTSKKLQKLISKL